MPLRCIHIFGLSLSLACAVASLQTTPLPAQLVHAKSGIVRSDHPTPGKWGDQGNGLYANPVMPADVSDLDAIRVGSSFYAITSTFQYSPGIAVLASHDLVNWQIVSHVIPDLTKISPSLNWDKMDRAGRGIWAGSLRFHAGRYWVVFGTPDEGLFLSTAASPLGPWTTVHPLLPQAGWDDPCPFWDDDGQGYLVATHFKPQSDGRAYTIHLWKLSADNQTLLADTDRILYQSNGSEANKFYKINGFYYHYFSEVHPEGRVPMMRRSRTLNGPWQTRQLMHVHPSLDKEPNQGGLLQLPDGNWFFLTHQGTGDWEGRAGVLLPITWKDGWPVPGKLGSDGIGNMLWAGKKPIAGFPRTSLAASDDFDTTTLKPAWEWNYQPRSDAWSLTERPGFLRLHATAPLRHGDFNTISNIITQRSTRTSRSQFTVLLDLAGMASGQQAGLAHYAKTFATLAIVQHGSNGPDGSEKTDKSDGPLRSLVCAQNGQPQIEVALHQTKIWLRSTWDFNGTSRFSYSLNGQSFTNIGSPYQLTWGNYRGDRIGLYTTSENNGGGSGGGYIDIDSVRYIEAR